MQRMLEGSETGASQVMQEQALDSLDLLKVDVERAEMEALRGIAPGDWCKIQQVVMEVHDIAGRLEETIGLLKEVGFVSITTDQPGSMQGFELWNLFASPR